jgi:cytochrome d ubiquinol oxidase subunit I
LFSAVWIIIAYSWMQTPAGFHVVGHGLKARAEVTDFWAMVFNPSTVERLTHTLMGTWQAGAFLVLSVSAYYLLKKRHVAFAQACIRIAMPYALVAALLQLVTGHQSAIVVAEHQPAKLAAMEGHWPSEGPAPLHLVGWVDEQAERTYGVRVPGLMSFLVHGDFNAPVTGLSSFAPNNRPPVNATFQFFHGMVAIGMALIAISIIGTWRLWRGTLWKSRVFLWILVFSVLGPQIANQLGWFTAEVGRQPWIVYGLLRTSDGVSKTVTANMILSSLIMFTFIYILLFALFIFLLDQKIRKGPGEELAGKLYGKQDYVA